MTTTIFQRRPLAPLTDATGSGSWPTPNASPITFDGPHLSGDGRTKPNKLGWAVAEAERGMWPTPNATDYKGANPLERRPVGDDDLPTRVKRDWPTPTARLGTARGPQAKRYHDPARSNDLDDAVAASGTPGSLNPTWVEWLMGYPSGWTDCAPSATASSPRSPSGSDAGSSNGSA